MTVFFLWTAVFVLLVASCSLTVISANMFWKNVELKAENEKLVTEAIILAGCESPFEQAELLLSEAEKAYNRCYHSVQVHGDVWPGVKGFEKSLEDLQALEIQYRREQREVKS